MAGVTSTIQDSYYSFTSSVREKGLSNNVTYRVAWGYQKLIGKHGFIDFNIGPSYSPDSELAFDIAVDLKFGLKF